MTYEKPELLVLSFGRSAVRASDINPGTLDGSGKVAVAAETPGGDTDGTTGHNAATSSSSGAYESDE